MELSYSLSSSRLTYFTPFNVDIECRLVKAFEQTYTAQKVDRRLRWLPPLGNVEIDVELQDRTLSLEVTPLQASVIELFGTSGKQRNTSH
jgi:hypothetical protein